jgi:hypothetical protein
MHSIFTRNQRARTTRALKATVVATVLFGGGYWWQQAATERIVERAEQARVEQLRMTPRKLEALAREADIAAAAQAYAEQYEAERRARTLVRDAQTQNAPHTQHNQAPGI